MHVTLVSTSDESIGEMEKLEAHQRGVLHRAFSVLLFNDKDEMLIQQRAFEKYHSAGLWANACCGHPMPGEQTKAAAAKRLRQEMGFTCELNFKDKFIYHTRFENGLTEHECDHLFTGTYNGTVNPDKNEVANYKWIAVADLKEEIKSHPQQFAFWFREIVNLYF